MKYLPPSVKEQHFFWLHNAYCAFSLAGIRYIPTFIQPLTDVNVYAGLCYNAGGYVWDGGGPRGLSSQLSSLYLFKEKWHIHCQPPNAAWSLGEADRPCTHTRPHAPAYTAIHTHHIHSREEWHFCNDCCKNALDNGCSFPQADK